MKVEGFKLEVVLSIIFVLACLGVILYYVFAD
jgi:hypothetical protein